MSSDYRMVVLDVETTITDGNPSSFIPENKVVLWGMKEGGRALIRFSTTPDEIWLHGIDPILYIGHNVKFDMHYLISSGGELDDIGEALVDKDRLWDTMVAEYYLSGMQYTLRSGGLSLDDVCRRRGLPVKDDKVTAYFKKGLGADHVPSDELSEYLQHDLSVTQTIFEQQVLEAEERGMLPLLWTVMDALATTVLMEQEGMYLDLYGLMREQEHLEERLADISNTILNSIHKHVDPNVADVFKITSPQQWNALLFGGSFTYKKEGLMSDEDGNPVYYKSGKRKGVRRTKMMEYTTTVSPLYTDSTVGLTKTGKTGMYTINPPNIQILLDNTVDPVVNSLLTNLLQHKTISKQVKTYYEGIRTQAIHNVVHPTYHLCSTATGRPSCANPNLQNITR